MGVNKPLLTGSGPQAVVRWPPLRAITCLQGLWLCEDSDVARSSGMAGSGDPGGWEVSVPGTRTSERLRLSWGPSTGQGS